MWCLVTDLAKNKQALAVTLSLKGQSKAIALELDRDILHSDGGIKYLLDALDPVFRKDETDISYSVYRDFESYEKTNSQSMNDYIVEFEI